MVTRLYFHRTARYVTMDLFLYMDHGTARYVTIDLFLDMDHGTAWCGTIDIFLDNSSYRLCSMSSHNSSAVYVTVRPWRCANKDKR